MKIRINNINFPFSLSIVIIAAIIFLVLLGNWQISRLGQKENLVESITYSIENDPVEITTPADLQNVETDLSGKKHDKFDKSLRLFSKIELEGNFINQNIFLYGKRSASSEKDGYYVLSPFKVKSSSNDNLYNNYNSDEDSESKDLILIVMRGWIPQSIKTKIDNDEISLNTNPQIKSDTIEAIIMPPEKKQFFAPGNDLNKNIWFHILPQDAVIKYGVNVTDFYLRQTNPITLPEGMKKLDVSRLAHIRNDHLEYAITWYLLALSIFICFVVYCKRNSSIS